MAEVSEEQLAIYRRAVGLIEQLESNPTAKVHLERAVKVVVPTVQTEEDLAQRITQPVAERVDQLSEQLKQLQETLTAKDAAASERQVQEHLDTTFGQLRANGYTDDGIERIKKIMVERNVADVDAAVALFDRLNPPPPPEQPGFTPPTWSLDSTAAPGTDMKELFADESSWADKMAAQTLNEIRLGRQ